VLTIANKKDLGLVNQAIKQRWNVDREAVKAALVRCLEDPKLAPKAAKILIDADAIDVKREKQALKQEAIDLEYRVRIVRILQRIPEHQLRLTAKAAGIELPDGPLFDTGAGPNV
jgi:hypothetical protein